MNTVLTVTVTYVAGKSHVTSCQLQLCSVVLSRKAHPLGREDAWATLAIIAAVAGSIIIVLVIFCCKRLHCCCWKTSARAIEESVRVPAVLYCCLLVQDINEHVVCVCLADTKDSNREFLGHNPRL